MIGSTTRRILLAALLGLAVTAGLMADDDARKAGQLLPLQTVLARVDARFDGTVIDADLMQARKGRVVYEVRLLSRQGNVIRIQLDAATGAFLDIEGHGFIEAQRP